MRRRAPRERSTAVDPPVVFLFPGQDSVYGGMGRELLETAPVFREAIERCDGILGESLDRPLRSRYDSAEPASGRVARAGESRLPPRRPCSPSSMP